MKTKITLLAICALFFFTNDAVAQSTKSIKLRKYIKSSMKDKGFRLIEEGGEANNTKTNVLGTDMRHFTKNRQYIFYGFIDDCPTCSPSIKFVKPGETPAYLPNEKATTIRQGNVTIISKSIRFRSSGEGLFALFSNSNVKQYSYCMLFVKD